MEVNNKKIKQIDLQQIKDKTKNNPLLNTKKIG